MRDGKMKFGLLEYELVNNRFNLGDYVQSLAAEQYLPKVDDFLNREKLNDYRGKPISIILNGWFMHNPKNWPPSKDINPLFISFHMNRPYISQMMTPNAISYMKDQGKIGCRDYHTAEVLGEHGIDTYYSCCLTTTLGNRYAYHGDRSGIFFVDVLHNVPSMNKYIGMRPRYLASHFKSGNIIRSINRHSILNKLLNSVPNDIKGEIKFFENSIYGQNIPQLARFDMAREYLHMLARARLVITSRIHCALPCIALGTPVVFIKYGQKSLSNIYRFRGILDHFNVVDLDKDLKSNGFKSQFINLEDIDWINPIENPNTHLPYAAELSSRAEKFISSATQ